MGVTKKSLKFLGYKKSFKIFDCRKRFKFMMFGGGVNFERFSRITKKVEIFGNRNSYEKAQKKLKFMRLNANHKTMIFVGLTSCVWLTRKSRKFLRRQKKAENFCNRNSY